MRVVLAALVVLGACSYTTPFATGTPGDGPEVVPDAILKCPSVSRACVTNTVLRSCDVTGDPSSDETCIWGCVQEIATAHCGVVVPSGGAATATDFNTTGLADVTLSGTVDGNNGSISGVTLRNSVTGIDAGIDYQVRNNIAVFRVKSLTVSGPLSLRGSKPIVFVADGQILIKGIVDVTGGCNASDAGPGGGVGGAKRSGGPGSGGGNGAVASQVGGAGGGFGGDGGDSGLGTVQGGGHFGDERITTLRGGGGGGGGDGSNAGAGGGGGGGVQFLSNTNLLLDVDGGITAGGCGGKGGNSNDGGGGGGAGGAILLEAPSIVLRGALASNGGAGGTGGAKSGPNATLDRNRAHGPNTPGLAGDGGGGAQDGGAFGISQGGGGGATGRIRFQTRLGQTTLESPILSMSLTDNSTTTTQGPATVQ